ncbi:hypothetical protein [Clostridium transplantifaecale]|uniref:hypothetical protein n=1 Tax=Clostridium transplantifaecale TaxID=2479838 RepID=UPI000F640FFA|nr:hypothetical protein [Clostridium transplantifaecale]
MNLNVSGMTATTTATTISNSEGTMLITISTGVRQRFIMGRVNSTIDLTNYKFINLNIISTDKDYNEDGSTITVGCSSSASITTKSSLKAYIDTRNTGIMRLDIASVTGSNYLYVGAYSSFSNHDSFLKFNQLFLTNT